MPTQDKAVTDMPKKKLDLEGVLFYFFLLATVAIIPIGSAIVLIKVANNPNLIP
jgi:hypothetical protein